jgi:hypothetical protein
MAQQQQAAAVLQQQQQQQQLLLQQHQHQQQQQQQQQQHGSYAAYYQQSILAAAAVATAGGIDSAPMQMPIPLNEAQQAFAMQAYAAQYAAQGYDYRHLTAVEHQQLQLQQLQHLHLQQHVYPYAAVGTAAAAAAVPLVASSDAYAIQGWHMAAHTVIPHAAAYAYPYEHNGVPVVFAHPEAAWLQLQQQQQQHQQQQLLPQLYAEQQQQQQQHQQQQHSVAHIVQPQPVQAAHVQLFEDIVQGDEVLEEDLQEVDVDEVQEDEVYFEAGELSFSKSVKEELSLEERQERYVLAPHTHNLSYLKMQCYVAC